MIFAAYVTIQKIYDINLMKTLSSIVSAGVLSVILFAEKTFASGSAYISNDDKYAGAVDQPFRDAVISFINYFLGFLGLIAVVMVIYAGILLVTGQGEEEQINKGKKIILWAAIGILVIMLSYTFVRVIAGAGDIVGA